MNLDESHFDTLDAINIWFGKCQVGAVNVQISDREVRILINDPTQPKETITFNVSTSSIVKTVCHFGDNSTIMFRILKHDLEHIGTKLNLNGPSNIDFEPNGNHWIRIETARLTDDIKARFERVFANYDIIQSDEMEKMIEFFIQNNRKSTKVQKTENLSDSMKKTTPILEYPPNVTGAISIFIDDYKRLEVDAFLNDVIISFYIEYLRCEVFTSEQKEKSHIFNTFFYNALTDRAPRGSINTARLTPAQKRHNRVKKWTKDVNIFEKDFIIVPINKAAHWFLVIICFPSLKYAVNMVTGERIPDKNRSNKKKPRLRSRILSQEDDDVDNDDDVDVKRPCILVFNSMSGSGESEINIIRDYLNCEREAKLTGDTYKYDADNMPGFQVRVPYQSNTSDCGVFLLQNLEQFFSDPIKSYKLPIRGMKQWYEPETATRKRRIIAELIQQKMRMNNGISVNELPDIELPD